MAADSTQSGSDLDRVITAWKLSVGEAADIFGVDRRVVVEWGRSGVPAGHKSALMDLVAATDRLEQRVERDRIPAIVRRPAESLNGYSLLSLAQDGRHAEVREAVDEMFDLRHTQP